MKPDEAIACIRALAAEPGNPSAQSVLLLAWREQVQADADAQFGERESVTAAKYAARCNHGDYWNAPVAPHPGVPWVNRLRLPGTFIDHTEFRWPSDCVVDSISAASMAVPLWVHYWRAVNEVHVLTKESLAGVFPTKAGT